MRDIGMEILIEIIQKKYILLYNGMHFSNAQFMLMDQCWIIFFSFLNHALFLFGQFFHWNIKCQCVNVSCFLIGMSDMSGCSGCILYKEGTPQGNAIYILNVEIWGFQANLQNSKGEPTLQPSCSAVILSQPCFRCTLRLLFSYRPLL